MDLSQLQYVGFMRRLIASIIDSFIFWAVYLVGVLFLLSLFGVSGLQRIFGEEVEYYFFFGSFSIFDGRWLSNLLFLAATVYFWVRFGGTPGKLLMRCHVVDADTGKLITPAKAVIRYLAYFLSLLPFGLGFFWILWDKRKQGFHDKIAKTVVVVEHEHWQVDESQKSLDQLLQELR
ncbi:MAG: RDD family protein [Gammaproteobacteria bacterium]|nr:RDD family protein [Gammaproteobacteria bacterium]